MNKLRRRLLGGALLAGAAYSYHRGLRYPPLWVEPKAKASSWHIDGLSLEASGAIQTPMQDGRLRLRAIEPEPRLSLALEQGEYHFFLTNVSDRATLDISANEAGVSLDESIEGLQRSIKVSANSAATLDIHWRLPATDGFKFAIIGDTGGGEELHWALQRAKQLDNLFLLHLGDFNYGNDEYQGAIDAFNKSPLPCYVTLGNHDFHDDGNIYHRFRDEIGPMNSAFTLSGFQFINLDTAADFFPASGGLRGDLVEKLQHDQTRYSDRLVFTHRPLRDPRPGNDHIVGGVGEVEWLAQQLQSMNANTLVTGHVHHSAELEISGLRQWTAGEGLGHENIVLQRQVAQMLIGQAEVGRKLQFSWVDLELPWHLHTSHTHEKKLVKDRRHKQLDWYLNKLQKT